MSLKCRFFLGEFCREVLFLSVGGAANAFHDTRSLKCFYFSASV